jgi:hypothetical protein
MTAASTAFTWSWMTLIVPSIPATLSSMPATLLSTLIMLFAIPSTLSSTVLATFRISAAAIRASSCVSRSSLFNTSSISVLPISFFRYFSGNCSVNGNVIIQRQLTHPSLPDLFGCNSKHVQNFHQYFCDYIYHFLVKCSFSVNLQSLEECFYALEDLKKCVLTCVNIIGCLRASVL